MRLIDDLRWALDKIFYDWRERKPKQVRNVLPPSKTASALRYIRINACRMAAPKTIECAKWTQRNPSPPNPEIPSYPLDFDEPEGPFINAVDFVCAGCTHPEVDINTMISRLGLNQTQPDFNERTWRRYVNDKEPMPVEQFQRAVANAFAHGYLGLWQAISEQMHITQLQAAQRGLLAVFRRAKERKAFKEERKLDVSEEELEQELEKQLRMLDTEMTRAIDQRLQAGDLPPELEEFMRETLREERQKKRR